MVDYSAYSTILFIDSMVALEGKPLADQPWSEIDPIGPILILVVPQVNTEIDKRKRDGRLGNRARAFNRLIAQAATSGAPHRIVEGMPSVDLGIAITNRIDWDSLDDLDPEDPDARVVAQILNARDVPSERKGLLTQDTNPISMAARHDLKATRLPDHWLLEPEPSPADKAVAKLKARVTELESTEPDLEVDLKFKVKEPLVLYKVRPLSKDAQDALVRHLRNENPPEANGRHGQFHLIHDSDSRYDDKYDRYRDVYIPRYVQSLHNNLEIWYGQIPFELTLSNAGHVQAENLILKLDSSGKLHDRFASFPIWGPVAPTPRPYKLTDHVFNIPQTKRPAGRHEMDFAVDPNRESEITVHCEDYRHGRSWAFSGIATIDPYIPSPFKILVSASASNMRGARTASFEIPFTVEEVDVSDLIDPLKRERTKDLQVEDLFEKALAAKDYSWFQMLSFGKNWDEISPIASSKNDDDDDDDDDDDV
jgi:hypothetical protein